MRLSLSQLTAPALPLDAFLDLAAQHGFDAVSLTLASLEAFGVESGLERIEASGLGVSLVYGLSADADIDATRRSVELAARTGGDVLLLTTGPARDLTYAEAEERFRRAAAPILEVAARGGMRLALEPLNTCRYDITFLHRVEDALDLVESIGAPHLGVCFELNTAWVERNLYREIRERLDRVFIVQLNDHAPQDPPAPVRVPLGDGVIPLRPILSAFESAGYAGYYDLEILGPVLEAIGPETAIRRSLAFLKTL